MSLSAKTQKIQELFNKMQKAIVNFDSLIFPHEYTAFEIYKIHIETLMTTIEDDIRAKLLLALFRQLFEDENDFKLYTEKKAEYINLVIDKLDAKSKEDKEDADNDIESEIIPLLFNAKIEKEKKNLIKNFVETLNKKLKIECELYYMLLLILIESGLKLNILIEYLPQILKEKYPDSTFDFCDALKSGITFDEFIKIFVHVIVMEKNYNYATFQFSKEKKDILISHKSINDIANIILTTSNKDKKKKKKKKKQNTEINEKELSKENCEENIPNLNVDDNSNNISNIDTQNIDILVNNNNDDNEVPDESKAINKEDVRKLIKETIEKLNLQFNAKINKLDSENKKVNSQLVDKINKLNTENEDLKSQFNKLNTEKEDLKSQFNAKISKLEADNISMKNDNGQLKTHLKKMKNEINKLNLKIMDNKKKITSMEFDIKIIGLRDAYKSFIDLLIFVMDLKIQGNIDTKIKSIMNYIKNSKCKNAEKINLLLADSSKILDHANDKAHFINFDESLLQQLILNLSKFSRNKGYLNLIDVLKSLNIENELQRLIVNRIEKYKKSKEDFKNNLMLIKESIQKNPLIADGNGLSTFLNS